MLLEIGLLGNTRTHEAIQPTDKPPGGRARPERRRRIYRLDPVKEEIAEGTEPAAKEKTAGRTTVAEVTALLERYAESDEADTDLFDCIIDMAENSKEEDCDQVAKLLVRHIQRSEDAGTLDCAAANMLNVLYRGTSHCRRSIGALSKEILQSLESEEETEEGERLQGTGQRGIQSGPL